MREKIVLLVTILLVLTGLTLVTASKAEGSSVIYIDKHVTGWGIKHAAAAWTDTGVATIVLVDSCAGLTPCVNIYPSTDLPRTWMAATFINSAEQWINVNTRYQSWPRRYKRETMCHEFGHLLGYPHGKGNCMEPYNTGRYTTP